ncbi:glycosyltransferase family 2 protein [Phaeobacter inhibens]|uniref:glycosyltransferase family 2 protein n=1 Tax=Phaeobacter inhibens TaxID=221822 RepID=UPI000C9BDAFE|nr:glycosyltransferase family 2 protein [Phaeobacter inhibens]AUQ63200.1 Glycosyl transferase family 2 [Phaeobacter inhibens]AUQ83104.1 Glycosyl transferase family 2 [Phaeobacter inhibens]AUQ90865.1 Glycosyl transferase family 2 [Phaeobacter inhibens]MDO6758218.1 glycosyltransferase family 2 protein [Phaeobacter inhibens]
MTAAPTAKAKRLIITCMKNEGPFILEWVAHHRAIGFDHMLVFTNDCDDGTVELLDGLAERGYVTRMDNPYQEMGSSYNPQKGALKFAESLDLVQQAEWVLVSDVDEFVNIHVGDGDLDSLFAATNGPDMISMQWRLFGNSFRNSYDDVLLTQRHSYCAPKYCPAPIQAWGIKTLFKTAGDHVAGSYDRIGVHRPLKRRIAGMPNWVAGTGRPVPEDMADQGWRFGIRDHGYDMVTLNHYAVRSTESFLVKRDRGRVNHVERDQGLAYWMRMNFNMEQDFSIQRRLTATKKELTRLKRLKGIKALHEAAVTAHHSKITELMARDDMKRFYDEITSPKLTLLSRHLNFASRAQFNDGPDAISADLMDRLAQVPVL